MSTESPSASEDISRRVPCRKCPAMILEATAARNRGYCANCFRSHGLRARIVKVVQFVGAMIGLTCVLLALPFILTFLGIQEAIRTLRFPFDRAALLKAIRRFHPDGHDGRTYLKGVIDGYWDATLRRREVRDESPYDFGFADGRMLRAGEIDVSDIPTHRTPIPPPAHIPGVKYRTGAVSRAQSQHQTITPSIS